MITYTPYLRNENSGTERTERETTRSYQPRYFENSNWDDSHPISTYSPGWWSNWSAPWQELPDDAIHGRFSDREDFKRTMTAAYEEELSRHGLNPGFARSLAAQDALESNYGSQLSANFNYGGIKDFSNGRSAMTTEYINGQYEEVSQPFRDFSSISEYVRYKVGLLNNSRYNAFGGSVSDFAHRVASGGYATAPNYEEVLNQLISTFKRGGVLKFDEGGYLSRNSEHYNNINYYGLPVGNLPSNVIRYYSRFNNENENELVVRNLSSNIQDIMDKWGDDMFNDGINYNFSYDNPEALGLRLLNYFENQGYNQLNARDTIRYINNDQRRYVTGVRVDDNGNTRPSYNDSNNIYNRYNPAFIADILRLFYGISTHKFGGNIIPHFLPNIPNLSAFNNKPLPQLARRGAKIKKCQYGGDISRRVFDWASNKNGELRYALSHNEGYPTFYQLLRDRNRPVLELEDGNTGTHKLAYAERNGKWYIYPEIQWVQDANGNWVGTDYSLEDDWTVGFDNAWNSGDYLEIPTEEMARYFTENYKQYSDWYPGFNYTPPQNTSSSQTATSTPTRTTTSTPTSSSYIYSTTRTYDPNQLANDGTKYIDIVRNRINMASNALRRNGVTNPNDIARLAYFLAMQSIRETGWVNIDSKNNYGGYLSGDQKIRYDSPDAFWDAHIRNLDDKWSSWRNANNITEYLHTLNDPDWYMRSSEEIRREQARREALGETLYLYAPAYANKGKDYFREVMDVADRFTYYYNLGNANNTR